MYANKVQILYCNPQVSPQGHSNTFINYGYYKILALGFLQTKEEDFQILSTKIIPSSNRKRQFLRSLNKIWMCNIFYFRQPRS